MVGLGFRDSARESTGERRINGAHCLHVLANVPEPLADLAGNTEDHSVAVREL